MIPMYKRLAAICLPQPSLKRALDDSFIPRIVVNQVWTLLLALLLAPAAAGQDAKSDEHLRFELFNDCKPMDLVVERLHDDAGKIGLTKARLQAAAESRLRSARLYDSDAAAYLYMNVAVASPAFSIRLEYRKRVFDPASVKSGYAATWNTGSTGTHGGDAGYIVSALSEKLDRFLVEYLRVNESACSR